MIKLFELRGTRTTLALGGCIIPSGPKLLKMPVVFAGSPDIAHRSLSADPAEKKLYSSRIIMQKMLRLSLNINVSIANWQNSTKNQTSSSRVKQRDSKLEKFPPNSSHVFKWRKSILYLWGTASCLVLALLMSQDLLSLERTQQGQ